MTFLNHPLLAKTRLRIFLGFAVLAIARLSPCASQQLRSVSFELNVGAGFGGSSAQYGPSQGASADLLLGFRPGAHAAGGLVLAASGSGQAFGVHFDCDVVPGGSCTPEFPDFWMLAALVGWETGNGRARVLVGPALATSSSKRVGAAQARLELAQPIFSHFALLTSARFGYVPKYRGDSFRLASIGIGFRLR